MTETVLSIALATYIILVFELTATPTGELPTEAVSTTVFVVPIYNGCCIRIIISHIDHTSF